MEMDNNKKQEIIDALQKAYWKEMETIMNYMANSVNLDGIRAREINEILSEEVNEELNHATKLANRIKELDGIVEGSEKFKPEQNTAQPREDTTDIKAVVQGVLDAESDAISHYRYIIDITEGVDHVTQDLAINLKADEEHHYRIFRGFKKALEQEEKEGVV